MNRRAKCCSGLAVLVVALSLATRAAAQSDPLPSWNDTPAKKAILDFVRVTTDSTSPKYVRPEDRIATFDEDGTTWVEHPMYTEVVFSLDRVVELAPTHPEWKNKMPFKAVIDGDRKAMEKLNLRDLMEIVVVTHTDVTTDEFNKAVKEWIATAKHPRWANSFSAADPS